MPTVGEEQIPRPFVTTLLTEILNNQDLEMPNKADSENYIVLEMYHVENYEEFSCSDSSRQCYNENEVCEEAIVEQVAVKCQKISEAQETDKDDTIERERVTNQDARKFIAVLRLYFMQEGNEDSSIYLH